MTVSKLRVVAKNRRSMGDTIAANLIPLEQSAQLTATGASRFVADILQAHSDAGLPPAAGMDIVKTLSDAASLAVQSRAKIGEAHLALRLFSELHRIEFSGPPECPPNKVFTGA